MWRFTLTSLRRLNIATHRDLGYFFCALILAYCISGIALNHIDDWNPDFFINKSEVIVPESYSAETFTDAEARSISKLVGEEKYKVFDFPTFDQVKIYYHNATLHVNFSTRKALYEKLTRKPLFYETNVLHRNSLKGWKWASDVFAIALIIINLTGLFILKGKHGITKRGKWLVIAGFIPPVAALILFEILG